MRFPLLEVGSGRPGGMSPPAAVSVVVHTDAPPGLLDVWAELVERTPGTDVTQLPAWARVRRTVGFHAVHVVARVDGAVVGGAQVLCRRVSVLGSVGYLPYGPLVAPEVADRAAVAESLARALRGVCGGPAGALFVQPPEDGDDVATALRNHGFTDSSAAIAPAGSIRIDLREDLAVIRSRFGRRLRSWPNRWAARGVTVSEGGIDDVPLLRRLMEHSAERQHFPVPPLSYLTALYRELAATGNAALFVGRVDGVPVAADLVTVCGGMIRGRYTGFARDGEAARLSVPAAIRWEIIRWGRERGLRWLDFGGLSAVTLDAVLDPRTPDGPPPDAVATVDQPKLTFGGTAFRYPAPLQFVGPSPVRFAYDLANRSPTGRRMIDRARRLMRAGRARPAGGGGKA